MLEQLPAPRGVLAEARQQLGRNDMQEFRCQMEELAI